MSEPLLRSRANNFASPLVDNQRKSRESSAIRLNQLVNPVLLRFPPPRSATLLRSFTAIRFERYVAYTEPRGKMTDVGNIFNPPRRTRFPIRSSAAGWNGNIVNLSGSRQPPRQPFKKTLVSIGSRETFTRCLSCNEENFRVKFTSSRTRLEHCLNLQAFSRPLQRTLTYLLYYLLVSSMRDRRDRFMIIASRNFI